MGHPIKLQILSALSDEGPQSALEIASKIAVPVRSVRHQLSRLAADGLVRVIASRARRGALEKVYEVRIVPRLDVAEHEGMASEESRRLTTEIFRLIVADMTRALLAGSFDWNDSTEIRIEAEVDDQGWEELARIIRHAYGEVEEAKVRAGRRLARSQEDPKQSTSVLLLFERPGPGDADSAPASSRLPSDRSFAAPGARFGEGAGRQSWHLAEAMAHPVRAMIMHALDGPRLLSVAQIAERIREPPRKVRHHLGHLASGGLVAKAGDAGRSPARYELLVPPVLEKDQLAELTPAQRRRIWIEVFRAILIDAVRAISAGTFYRRPTFVEARIPAAVDSQGWGEIQAISRRAFESIDAARLDAAARLAVSGAEPVSATAAIFWVELPTA